MMKTNRLMTKSALFLVLFLVLRTVMMQAQAGVTGFETVHVTIPATGYNAAAGAPQMARVKYNKKFPLVVTSDDMGKTELTNNWAEVNGYPNVNNTIDLGIQPGGTKFLAAPYKKYYTQHESQAVADYEPMTYTDNVGKQQRYRMTSAIMPYDVNSNNYAKINAEDAKLMLRTGWSFAQHDVDNISSVENISTAMTNNSNIWANKVGIGLKVMVEPNGNHQYLDAGRQNSGVCWNIFQNPTSQYPSNSKEIADWTDGTMPTSFTSKPQGGFTRSFFQGHESEWKNEVNGADGTRMIIGGTHGLGDDIKQHLRTAANVKDNAWVASADEVWEYYHIYNNVKIGEATFTDDKLTFDVQVPTYQKNQYRELTLNIPGLTGGSEPTFTGTTTPVTGGYKQTTDASIGYTMNIGMETSINQHIDELMNIYRDDQTNEFVKRDIRYLASQLWNASDCIARLDAAPVYSHTINARLDGTSDSDYPLAMIKTDTNGDKSFRIPRYVAKNGSLYETAGAAAGPKYAKTIATAGTSSDVDYANKNLDSSVVLYAEGEDLEGTTVIGADLEYNKHQDGRYYATNLASMGMAGSIVSGSPATVSKTLPRGKYKITVGYGESYKSQGIYNYHVKVGDTQVYTFANSDASDKVVTEFTSDAFNIEQDNTPVTITTDNTNADSRWIDYVYVQKTADLEAVAPAVTFASSATTSTIKTGTTATLTANALPNGGSNLTTSIYASDSEGNISGSALATGVESASYAFTPAAEGTSYFLAQSTNSAGVTKSELIALTATDITNYTLNIVDKSGNTAMTATIANPGSPAQADPLPVAYRSPFAENYHYYLTATDAQNNNTANALANTDAWTAATIYVGYDVKSTFGSDKKFAVWSNRDNQYMHVAVRPNGSGETGQINLERQKYNIWNENPSGANFSYVEANSNNYALLDNLFMWQLGDDPYNITFKNVAMHKYANPIKSDKSASLDATSTSSYCILYWTSHAGATDTTTPYLTRVYYRGSAANTPQYVVGTTNNTNDWRVDITSAGNYTNGSKIYIKDLTNNEVTVNVLDSLGTVEAQIQAYNNSTATMQSIIPYSMIRAYTSNHAFYYDPAHSDAVTAAAVLNTSKLEANGGNLYMTYTLGSEWRTLTKDAYTPNVMSFDAATDDYANWYGMRYNDNSGRFLKANTGTLPQTTSTDSNLSNIQGDTDAAKQGQWTFIGTPYNLRIANRYHGFDSSLGIASNATSSTRPNIYASDATDVITTWEVTNCLNQKGTSHVFFRPQGGINGQAPYLYLGNNNNSSGALVKAAGGGEMWYFYWTAETQEHYAPAATLTLSAAETDVYVDHATTLTATATPAAGHSVTYFAIERETAIDTWEVIGTAYSGENVSGASKDGETGVVTVTCSYSPAAEGTFNFRARAVCDNNAENYTILSTNTARDGGIGSVVTITATVKPFTVGSDNYTIVLVDKAGNELYTESNVPASRVSEANSVSGRNGDPLNNDWRSPLVTRYLYYKSAEGAKTNNSSDLFDWASTATTPTVYVGYEVGTDIDLNTKVTDISERVRRSNDDATMVRNASKFGTMYMLKFLNGVEDFMENGKDEVETEQKKQPVYPYANGDGAMYIYDQSRWDAQAEAGASTRTRWPWYLVSPTNDPYHVYVTAWQQSHTDAGTKTNYYNFFRTYYNSTISQVVTTSISDDPKATNTGLTGGAATNVPTQYMLLGTTGHYKLVTSDAVTGAADDVTYGGHQTVKTLENYWKNNPTVQTLAGVQDPAADNAKLIGKGWHRYESWAYAANWGEDSKTKTYSYGNHWYKTFDMGDGTFALEPTEIDAVLVLLDNHGWEVMRQKIAKHKEADKYAAAQAALRKFDSPMVEQYKFYGSKSVDHKVSGYHKYNINNGANKALTESDRAGADEVFTSLADYPESYAGGALKDLYVTYVVKPEYASTYQGATTEEGTSASQFVLRQGNNYAKANGTAIEGTTQENADKWYLKPNFNIDTEMGYEYDVDKDGLKTGIILDAAATNARYFENGQQGFDPYNLRIQNVSTSTYLTTDATTADLTGSIWSGNGSTVSLTDATSYFTDKGLDGTDVQISNATFMAVQDANGNMRLMPRFDFSKVVEGFTTLKEQAAAQSAGNTTHAQTTLLSTPVTYHIIDNSGADVFGALTANTAGFAVPKEYRSPMVEEYYYHSSLEDAQNNRTTASVTTVKPGDEVWVSYKAKEDFGSKDWIVYGQNGTYLHAVSRNNQTDKNYLWWMENQKNDRGANSVKNDLSTTNMPFLDNSYAWQFGENADPYNATFLNKAVHRYISSNNGNMNHLIPAVADAGKYAIVYYEEGSDDAVIYERDAKKYIYLNNNGQWYAKDGRDNNGRMVFDCNVPAIAINIVRNGKVECTLDGFYKSGCTWTPFVPLYLERYAASNQAFYYDQACKNAISGQVDDATVTANKAVYVSYTLDAAKWGTLDKNSSTTIVMPSPTNDKVEWYSMVSNNRTFFIDGNNQLVSGSFKAGDNVDSNDNKKGQWALMGTPYNVKIVNRYLGSTSYLGIPSEINNNPIQLPATVQPEGTENVVDTWEVCQGMGNSGYVLQFRPQGSLSGQATYGYLGQDGNTNGKLGVTVNPNGNLQVKLTWLKETDAKHVTFKLYDRNGNYMAETANGGIADVKIDGVSIGDDLSALFDHTNMQRRYCEYTFYSDAEMTNAVTVAGADLNETVYVKWDYTDDAPVFSQTGWDKRDYQYYMLGVWGFSNYNLMDVEGSGTTEDPYRFSPNNTVGTPRDLKHQFAIVGNPYGFKLYNRGADKDIRRNDALEITFADKEADGTTDTEEITFDLPIVSGSAYTSTETHFRSTKTGRYLSVTGTNENKLFSMTNNAGGYTRFRYIIVPVRVFKEGAVSSTAEKDYRMYALEMNPSNTARTTDARITTNDLRATGNAIGNARDFNHAFCNYTYYQAYDWNTSVSAPVPDDGLSYYGGKDQTKRQFIATYTVDQEAFERLYYLDNSPNHGNAYSSKGAESTSNAGSYTTLSDSRLEVVKADAKDIYRWRFTGDPYDLQIHNVNTDKQSEDYVLAVKTLTADPNTAPTEPAGTLALVTKDVKDGDSDTESYGQYSHWEIIKRSDNYYVLWNIDTNERYTYALTTRADKQAKNLLYVTVPPFVNGSTTVLNINQVEWNLVDVFNHYDVTWHVMEKTGETNYTEVASDTKVVDENVTLTIEDLPTSVKRHFCDYEKMYSDAACTTETEITEHTVNAATDIYVSYTLDSGAPDFITEADVTSSIADMYWYEIHYPGNSKYLYYNGSAMAHTSEDVEVIRIKTDYDHYRWALVGTPYSVKFYNKSSGSYLTTDGSALTVSVAGTSFDLMDDATGELCDIYDEQTKVYVHCTAGVQTTSSYHSTSAEFTNTNGVVKIKFVLHFSDKTLRTNTENKVITVDTYQKLGKSLDDVLPELWKRAFCKYTYHWDATTTESTTTEATVQTVSQTMVEAYNARRTLENPYLYVHVTYDFEGGQNPKWSTADKKYTGKHWYYLVNNHRPNGEQGKMVYRDVSPKLRVSTSLQQNRLYLNNFEWCVIGDPYGFKMLNRYDPDRRFDEYIRVTDSQDSHGDGLQLEQSSTDSQNIFEMMPGQYSYNFWMHPVYSDYIGEDEEDSDNDDVYNEYSYVGNNYNGSAAIIPNDQRSMTYLKTNSSANFRLEIQSDATLSEYVKYAGFVGGLKYDDKVTDVMREDAADGDLSNEDKATVRALIDNPENIVQMEQGYYRIVPYVLENGESHYYVQGYKEDGQRTSNAGGPAAMPVETQAEAEKDAASIFWFEGTTEDGTGYPRYYVKAQGLAMTNNGLTTEDNGYQVRYEDLGAAITQLKVGNEALKAYLSCSSTSGTSTNQCFDEQAGQFKTRFYLQKVGTENAAEMPLKKQMVKGHDGRPLLDGHEAWGDLPYTYWALYVPYDLQIIGGFDKDGTPVEPGDAGFDVVPFIGISEHHYDKYTSGSDTYYNEGEYALFCKSIDEYQSVNDWKNSKLYIPAGTPVMFRSLSGMQGITFTIPTTEPSEKIQENCLQGTYLKKANTDAQIRVFGKESVREDGTNKKYYTGRVGLFRRTNPSTPLSSNNIYYVDTRSQSSGAPGVLFSFAGDDETTGLNGTPLQTMPDDDSLYDLQGRKVVGTARPGVYIRNGRKVVIK
ncbi:MAG: hypothetical protein J6I31_00565 [Prevotella sp.]|nr:hypothetical protein [Prevotella sp.]